MSIYSQQQQLTDELRPNCLTKLSFFKHDPKSTSASSFLELAKQRHFDELVSLLPKATDSWLAVRRSDGTVSTCETLHALLMYQPPPAIVRALTERLKSNERVQPLVAVDAHGRTPLHIAVAKGCNYETIELLMEPSAITTRDNQGRYPLHWACINASSSSSSYSRLRLGRNRKKHVQTALRIVSALVEDYPEAATVCDAHGETPWDLLQRRNADPRILEQYQSLWKNKMQQRHPSTTTTTPECSWEQDEDGSGWDIPVIEVRRILEGEDAVLHPPPDNHRPDQEDEEDPNGEYDDISSVGCPSFSREKPKSGKQHSSRSKSKYPHEVVEF